jgi:SpoVK/Ycf46/Vps4 family AAA+-type ATPase
VLAPDVDMSAVAERLPTRMSGADLYAVCADALQAALGRRAADIAALCGARRCVRRGGGGG